MPSDSTPSDFELLPQELPLFDTLINNSRFTPSGNGNPNGGPICSPPSSGHKWWFAVLLGFIFAIVSSPLAYMVTSSISTNLGGMELVTYQQYNVVGLIIHTLIFIAIVRIILW